MRCPRLNKAQQAEYHRLSSETEGGHSKRHTDAGGVSRELVAVVTSASEADGGVDARVLAAAVVHGALVHRAPAARLVLPLAAVVVPVAHLARLDAQPAPAVELRLRVAPFPRRRRCNMQHFQLFSSVNCLLFTKYKSVFRELFVRTKDWVVRME